MPHLHEANLKKARIWLGYALSILPSLAVFLSGLDKFAQNPMGLETLENLGVAEHAVLIGAVEILVVLLYWIPRTSNIGFFLFCSYAGGIIVGELILGELPVPGLVIALLIYTGTFLRRPGLSGLGI